MKKNQLLNALFMLRNALKNYDTEVAHNILIDGGSDKSEEEMEEDLENYLQKLKVIIKEVKEFNF